mmetsp:Transcript_23021/g.35521  ORF Transcript_23021/g.35521 Transcript_23021/m.35521 type:complete len:792 (+) Transcript_23021:129-2504(+)
MKVLIQLLFLVGLGREFLKLPSTATAYSHLPTLNEPFQGSSFSHLPHKPCTTLYHRNGRVGCGTDSRGYDDNVGRLLGIGATGFSNPFVSVITQDQLTNQNMENLLQYSNELRGILVVNATTSTDNVDAEASSISFYSPAPPAPQGYGTASSEISISIGYPWNPTGQSLTSLDLYDVPIVYVQDGELSTYLLSVAKDQTDSTDRPIVADFNYYMGPPAPTNSIECLSWIDNDGEWRPKCLPLGGNSVWATAGSRPGETSSTNDDINNNNGRREIVMIASAMDGSSFFHDASPSANSAASNILSVLLAAKLVGESLSDAVLESLPKQIAFGLFQGESFGYIGSRSFFSDSYYPGFNCPEGSTAAYDSENNKTAYEMGEDACLYPLKPSLSFQKLGDVSFMLAVDQVGVLETEKTLYVHGNNAGNNGAGSFAGYVLNQMGTDSFSVMSSSAEPSDDDEYGDPIPPSPLTSLLKLSEGAVGGAVLTGYDSAYIDPNYQSHLDRNDVTRMDLDSIAATATILARSAVAIAYDGGDEDYEAASEYAKNTVQELNVDDETLLALSDCLFTDGKCDFWEKYTKVEKDNQYEHSGVSMLGDMSLGSPPNYYVNVYDLSNGQGFIRVNNQYYGAYDGEDFGKDKDDKVILLPTGLEAGIHGILNDFLGRGSVSNPEEFRSCSTSDDCDGVPYCSAGSSDHAVCTGGGVCVCSRAHFHTALDEGITPAANKSTGHFVPKDDESAESALYTEPYWSSDVGVKVYRDGGDFGYWALLSGFLCATGFVGASFSIKSKLKKEKLY